MTFGCAGLGGGAGSSARATEAPPFAIGGIATGVTDATLTGEAPKLAFGRVPAAGATVVRLAVAWPNVAPMDAHPAGGFDAADPEDPNYRWDGVDSAVLKATAAGLQPLLDVVGVPSWANDGGQAPDAPTQPNAKQLGLFATALAHRYSGSFQALPRVRYWQVWSEPNLTPNLAPQLVAGRPVAPARYLAMVNAVADGVKSVHTDNLVVAGGLAPFRDITPEVMRQNKDWGPLGFMRNMLCLSPTLKPTCSTRARFDIWSTHPYTSGGPTHHAVLPDDVSLGDLPEMRRVLQGAVRAHHIRSRGPVKFWVTEFSWDSSPPDPQGVPMSLLKRWVPQALYVMWQNGVSLVTWYSLRDEPLSSSFYQSGLYFRSRKPKPFFEGFRFPLVAFPRAGGVYVWGRTPFGLKGRVAVEQRVGDRWRQVGTVATDRFGIFQRRFRVAASGSMRARLLGSAERTLPFSLTAVPDRFFNPFGQTTLLEPKHG